MWVIPLIEIKQAESLTGSKDAKSEFILISPPNLSPSPYVGPLSCNSAVKPRTIGGTWYPSVPPSSSQLSSKTLEKRHIILHLHGGAYVVGSGRPDDCGFLASVLLKHTPASHIFIPQYRLASQPGNIFPAALQDAVTALFYLTHTLGYSLSEITLGGDSAGANLAMGLIRWVEKFGLESGLLVKNREDETFNAVFIMSLWADPFTPVRNPGYLDDRTRRRTDYLHESFGAWGARGLGLFSASSTDDILEWERYLTFSGEEGPFKAKPRIWFEMGECEVMYDTQMSVWKAFEEVEGNRVGGMVQPAMPHDILNVGEMLGLQANAVKLAKRVGVWMEAGNE